MILQHSVSISEIFGLLTQFALLEQKFEHWKLLLFPFQDIGLGTQSTETECGWQGSIPAVLLQRIGEVPRLLLRMGCLTSFYEGRTQNRLSNKADEDRYCYARLNKGPVD